MDPNPKQPDYISKTRSEVMRRVRVVSFVFAVISSPLAGVVGMLCLIFAAGTIVSLDNVAANTLAYSDWGSRFSYALLSIEHARIAVQAIAVALVVIGSLILVKSVRAVRRSGFLALFTLRRAG